MKDAIKPVPADTVPEKVNGIIPNTVISGLGLVLSFYVWISSGAFPEDLYNPTNSDFFPKICAAGLALSSTLLLISSLVVKDNDQYGSLSLRIRENQHVLVMIILSIAVYFTLKPVGFLIVMPLYMLGVEYLLGLRSWKRGLLTSVIFPLAVYFLFRELLMISMPLGLMKGML